MAGRHPLACGTHLVLFWFFSHVRVRVTGRKASCVENVPDTVIVTREAVVAGGGCVEHAMDGVRPSQGRTP